MPYCQACGCEVNADQHVCLNCGVLLKRDVKPSVYDEGGFLWGLLGFIVPIAGLVVYLLWKHERPVTAKAAGLGALIAVIVYVAFWVIYMMIIFFILW